MVQMLFFQIQQVPGPNFQKVGKSPGFNFEHKSVNIFYPHVLSARKNCLIDVLVETKKIVSLPTFLKEPVSSFKLLSIYTDPK